MKWFEEHAGFYGSEYLDHFKNILTVERTGREISAIEQLVELRPDTKILDIPCGHGRHSIELALRGYDATGVDLNAHFLQIAQKRAKEGGLSVEWIKEDMRTFSSPPVFDLAINLFTGFGYFEDDAEDKKILANIAHALKENGKLIVEYLNPTSLMRRVDATPKVAYPLADGSQLAIENWTDDERRYIFARYTRTLPSGEMHQQPTIRLRLYTKDNIIKIAEAADLKLNAVYGDYRLSALTDTSLCMLFLFSKRG